MFLSNKLKDNYGNYVFKDYCSMNIYNFARNWIALICVFELLWRQTLKFVHEMYGRKLHCHYSLDYWNNTSKIIALSVSITKRQKYIISFTSKVNDRVFICLWLNILKNIEKFLLKVLPKGNFLLRTS